MPSTRHLVLVAAGLVAAGAVVATAHGLFAVADAAKVPEVIAWLYPLITDGLALVAYAATHQLADSKRYAWSVVVLAAVLSGLAQAVYLAGGSTVQVSPPLAFGIGAWPAIAAAIVAHLVYLLMTPRLVEDSASIGGQATVAELIAAQDEDPDRGVIISRSSVRTCVYRLVDAAGQLLYVGITSNLAQRLKVHRASRSWWSDVAEVLIEDYPDRAAALAVEQSAITNEKPVYNVSGGGLRDQAGGSDDPLAHVGRIAYALDLESSESNADDGKGADEVAELRLRRLIPAPPVEDSGRPSSAARVAELAQDPSARARVLDIVNEGRGRATVMRKFDLSEHQARQLLKAIQGDEPVAVNGRTS